VVFNGRTLRKARWMFRTIRVAAVGIVLTGVGLAAFTAIASQAGAQSALVDVLAARVTVSQGGSPLEIVSGRVVRRGDRIRTDRTGQALITYRDGSTVLLDVDSEVVIELIEADERGVLVRMTQSLGRVWYSLSRTLSVDSRFEVRSAAMASVIRAGSDSYVVVGPGGETTVVATVGTVETAGAGVTVTVAAGSGTSVAVGSAPSSPAPAPSPSPQPTPAPSATPTATATPPTAPLPSTPAPAPRTPVLQPSPTPVPAAIPSSVISAAPSPLLSATPRAVPALTAEPTGAIAPLPTVSPLSPTLP
jgi:hypothetical protein